MIVLKSISPFLCGLALALLSSVELGNVARADNESRPINEWYPGDTVFSDEFLSLTVSYKRETKLFSQDGFYVLGLEATIGSNSRLRVDEVSTLVTCNGGDGQQDTFWVNSDDSEFNPGTTVRFWSEMTECPLDQAEPTVIVLHPGYRIIDNDNSVFFMNCDNPEGTARSLVTTPYVPIYAERSSRDRDTFVLTYGAIGSGQENGTSNRITISTHRSGSSTDGASETASAVSERLTYERTTIQTELFDLKSSICSNGANVQPGRSGVVAALEEAFQETVVGTHEQLNELRAECDAAGYVRIAPPCEEALALERAIDPHRYMQRMKDSCEAVGQWREYESLPELQDFARPSEEQLRSVGCGLEINCTQLDSEQESSTTPNTEIEAGPPPTHPDCLEYLEMRRLLDLERDGNPMMREGRG